ncbi:unnamed protein product [Rodentolepis nana]|uniref:Uncharacterized protein n=1 Tax=Rodentolepis nana TaxID=102285 RepID=A0A0R3TAW8_RODNA|nr:unnamed protein product [Rodentolepis nana]
MSVYKSIYSNRRVRWYLTAYSANCKLLCTDDDRQYVLQLAAVHTVVFIHFEAMDVDEMTLGHLLRVWSASPLSVDVKRDMGKE